nr:uncharacterized protein LOC115268314 [Aedes albopictus]
MSVKVGDLQLFKTRDNAYKNFIAELTTLFTEANEQYDGIKVSKRASGYTKVIIKHGQTEVPLVYRNRDLYIIGVIVGKVCYVDKKAHAEMNDLQELKKVIAPAKDERLSAEFSYQFIMPKAEHTEIRFEELEYYLQKLTLISDKMKRMEAMTFLSPFVVLFAEAIRFPVIATLAQRAFRSVDGTLKLSTDVAPPEMARNSYVIMIHKLLLNWGTLSSCVEALHKNNKCNATFGVRANPTWQFPEGKLTAKEVDINKGTLLALLGVANSCAFQKLKVSQGRGRRDISLKLFLQQQQALLHSQQNLLQYDGNGQPSTRDVLHHLDMTGTLCLATLGVLNFTGRRLQPTETDTTMDSSREAAAMAADLTQQIVQCMQFSGVLSNEIEYEVQIKLQRRLAVALYRREPIDGIVSSFIEENRQHDLVDTSV